MAYYLFVDIVSTKTVYLELEGIFHCNDLDKGCGIFVLWLTIRKWVALWCWMIKVFSHQVIVTNKGRIQLPNANPKPVLVDAQYLGHGFRWGFHFVVFGPPVDTSWLAF